MMSPFDMASTLTIASQRVAVSWPWYAIRAAGFVAVGLLILLILSGIGQVTGITYRFIEPAKSWIIHKTLAIALCASIIVHVGFLLIDKFMPFSLSAILVPFVSHYNNGTSFLGLQWGNIGVGLGILAVYGLIIILISSLYSSRRSKTWRRLHYLSYVIMFCIFLHALYVGTDIKYGSFRAAWVAVGLLTGLAMLIRLWRAGTLRKGSKTEVNK